ncbi:MAG: EamA family transporter [Chloroflexota bacterium]
MPIRRSLSGGAIVPIVILTIVTLIWSSNNIISKFALREMSPAMLNLVRFTVAAVIFHLPVFLIFLRSGEPLKREEWLRLAVIGIVGQCGSSMTYTIGLTYTSATHAALMLMTGPLWTGLLAFSFQGERLGRVQAVGMLIAFGAAVALSTGGGLTEVDANVLIGSAFFVTCQVLWAVYNVVGKRLLTRRHPMLVLAAGNLCAMVGLFPTTAALGADAELPGLVDVSASVWLWIIYLAVMTGAISQSLYLYGLRAVSASQAASFSYLMPLFTAVMAYFALAEVPTTQVLMFGPLIILGLYLVNRPPAGRAMPRPPLQTVRSSEASS